MYRIHAKLGGDRLLILMCSIVSFIPVGCGATLKGTHRFVHFDSEPRRATVTVDGVPRGETPVSMPLKTKSQHHVNLSAPGFRDTTLVIKNRLQAKWAILDAIVVGVPGLLVDAMTGGLHDLETGPLVTVNLKPNVPAPALRQTPVRPPSAPPSGPSPPLAAGSPKDRVHGLSQGQAPVRSDANLRDTAVPGPGTEVVEWAEEHRESSATIGGGTPGVVIQSGDLPDRQDSAPSGNSPWDTADLADGYAGGAAELATSFEGLSGTTSDEVLDAAIQGGTCLQSIAAAMRRDGSLPDVATLAPLYQSDADRQARRVAFSRLWTSAATGAASAGLLSALGACPMTRSERNALLAASGLCLLTTPGGPSRAADMGLAEKALCFAGTVLSESGDPKDMKKAVYLLGASALIGIARGTDTATTEESIKTLLMRTDQDFAAQALDHLKSIWAAGRSKNPARTPNDGPSEDGDGGAGQSLAGQESGTGGDDLTGEYYCVETSAPGGQCTETEVSTTEDGTTTTITYKVVQHGDAIEMTSSYIMRVPAQDTTGPYDWRYIWSGVEYSTESTCRGQLDGDVIELHCMSTASTSRSTGTQTYAGETRHFDNPPSASTSASSFTARVIGPGRLRLESQYGYWVIERRPGSHRDSLQEPGEPRTTGGQTGQAG